MKKAKWIIDYDFRQDKRFRSPGCPDCEETCYLFEDGQYRCLMCGDVLDLDKRMIKWMNKRLETKTKMIDCNILGCGGKKCVEAHYRRNPITLKWEFMSCVCKNCGLKMLV